MFQPTQINKTNTDGRLYNSIRNYILVTGGMPVCFVPSTSAMGVGQGLALVATTKPKARTRRGITSCQTTRHKKTLQKTAHVVHDTGGVRHQLLRYAIYYTGGVVSYQFSMMLMQLDKSNNCPPSFKTQAVIKENSFQDTTLASMSNSYIRL